MQLKYQFYSGLALIVLLLGCGILFSYYLIKINAAEVTPQQWQQITDTVNQLVEANNIKSDLQYTQAAPSPNSTHKLININNASENELENLTGIGPARAQAIIEARVSGPFVDIDDLHVRTPKIPLSTLQKIQNEIEF